VCTASRCAQLAVVHSRRRRHGKRECAPRESPCKKPELTCRGYAALNSCRTTAMLVKEPRRRKEASAEEPTESRPRGDVYSSVRPVFARRSVDATMNLLLKGFLNPCGSACLSEARRPCTGPTLGYTCALGGSRGHSSGRLFCNGADFGASLTRRTGSGRAQVSCARSGRDDVEVARFPAQRRRCATCAPRFVADGKGKPRGV